MAIDGEIVERVTDLFWGDAKLLPIVTAAMKIRRHFASWKETYDKPRQYIKKQRHHFVDKGP